MASDTPQYLYNTTLLYAQTEQELEHANRVEFQLLMKRQSILMQLINAGIETTTLKQLNSIT